MCCTIFSLSTKQNTKSQLPSHHSHPEFNSINFFSSQTFLSPEWMIAHSPCLSAHLTWLYKDCITLSPLYCLCASLFIFWCIFPARTSIVQPLNDSGLHTLFPPINCWYCRCVLCVNMDALSIEWAEQPPVLPHFLWMQTYAFQFFDSKCKPSQRQRKGRQYSQILVLLSWVQSKRLRLNCNRHSALSQQNIGCS